MKINPIINENSVTVFPHGCPITIRKDNVNFYQLRKACKAKDWAAIKRLSSVENTAKEAIRDAKMSASIEIRNGEILYKGKPLHNVVGEKLLSMIRDGMEDANPWIKFVEKLMQNPDRNSVEQLFNFLSHKELPITPDGDIIGYKGVENDFWSKRGNTETRVLQGKVDGRGRIWNGIGETIEVERNCVVNDPSLGCAEGVHIGSFDYATGWAGTGGKVVLVSFNPADAVSVPSLEIQKLRASKYKVVADVTGSLIDIKKSCVAANGSDNLIKVSDSSLKEAINDLLFDFDVDDIDLDLMEDEGAIPYGSDVTNERINMIFEGCVESDRPMSPTQERILSYVTSRCLKNGPIVYVKNIQSALSGVENLSSNEIVKICVGLGLCVKPNKSISKSIVSV